MKSLRLLSIKACLLLSFALATITHAHEGHGVHAGALDGMLHWFTEWDHIAVIVGALIAPSLLARRTIRWLSSHTRKSSRNECN